MLDGSIAFLVDKLFETSLSPRDPQVVKITKQLDMANKSAKIVCGRDQSETVLKISKILGNKKSQEIKKNALNNLLGINVVTAIDLDNAGPQGVNAVSWIYSNV